jgi:PII-like signaling protein
VNEDALKLTIYHGERDRTATGFVADALTDVYARHELQTSVLLRGIAGYGAKQHLHSDRQLTLSEDLPLVSIAVDTRARIERALEEIRPLGIEGLVTTERARLLTSPLEPVDLGDQAKLTLYLGRQERAAGRPAYQALVDQLHAAGIAGATVLLGVDGTAHGLRRRARFFGRNAEVPLMVISVGDGGRIATLLPELERVLARPLLTLERVRVLKRDGRRFGEPAADGPLQKLMVYASEQAQHEGRSLYSQLVRRLRAAGAAGATSLRGVWGYHGDHAPHGDTMWQLRRRVPVVTVVVDAPDRIAEWFGIVDELTAETGLVTSEMVPATPFTSSTGP